MRPWLLLLLLAACGAPAAMAAAEEYPEPETAACTHSNIGAIELSLPNIIMRRVREIPSSIGREASAYLAARPNLELKVAFGSEQAAVRLNRRTIKPNTLMAYRRLAAEPALEINHVLLHLGGGDEASFINNQGAQREFSDAVAGAFVHEVSHAREAEEIPALPRLLESEYAAFYRETLFTLDALKRLPDFNKLAACLPLHKRLAPLGARHEKLSKAAGKAAKKRAALVFNKMRDEMLADPLGRDCSFSRMAALDNLSGMAVSNAALEAYVSKLYELPGVNSDPAAQSRVVAEAQKKSAGNYHLIKNSKDDWAPGTFPPDFEETFSVLFSALAADKAFWDSPDRVKAARAYYERQLGPLRAEADSRRRSGELKPFLEPVRTKRSAAKI